MVDVAIVGGGPVGVVAANFCGVYGLSAVVLDREKDVYDLPRAAGLHHDAQRILHNAGVLDAVLPATRELLGAEFVDAGGERIIGFELPPGTLLESGYPAVLNIDQPGLERAVRGCLDRFPEVELRLGREVEGFEQSSSGVSLDVRSVDGGAAERLDARWLIGADGATSSVRRACEISWDSLGYDCDWLVVDLELTRDVELTMLATQVCDPNRPVTVIPMPGRQRRWEFQLKPGETRAEMEDRDRVWELLAPWLPRDAGEILRAVVYRFHATIAERFSRGRVFLAGDAAHQTPPFMGQGLCTGIRDVENLVWKLAMVAGGQASDRILETYTAERRPLAVAMVQHSTNTGKLIDAYAEMQRGGPEPPAWLQEYAYGGSQTLPDLSEGLLAADTCASAGCLLPHTEVLDGAGTTPFDAHVGPSWSLVSTEAFRLAIGEAVQRAGAALEVVLAIVSAEEGPIGALLQQHEVLLVRPDRLIYGACAATEVGGLLERLSAELR